MTFLLFLASLAVIEFLVRKPRGKADEPAKVVGSGGDTSRAAPPQAIPMPGLTALGRALEAQGRGEVPGDERVPRVPRVHGPPADGV